MLTRQDVEEALQYMDSEGLIRITKPTGNWYQLYCPFHNNGNERKPSCGCSLLGEVRNGIEYQPGMFHCFSCQATYPLSKGIKEILAMKGSSLASHPFLEKYVNDNEVVETHSLLPEGTMASLMNSFAIDDLRMRMKAKPNYISEQELAGYRFTVPYMYERKLTDAVIEKYDVGYDPNYIPAGRSKPLPCVTFPVKDLQGRTLFICRRSIQGKYFNIPEGIEKSVYGIYELPRGIKEVIVCESVFNALTSVVYGHPAVALFGTGTTHEIDQLRKLGVQSYVLCLDNDDAGRRGTEKLKKALSQTAMVWTMSVPEGFDVNDLDYETFIQCYNNRE